MISITSSISSRYILGHNGVPWHTSYLQEHFSYSTRRPVGKLLHLIHIGNMKEIHQWKELGTHNCHFSQPLQGGKQVKKDLIMDCLFIFVLGVKHWHPLVHLSFIGGFMPLCCGMFPKCLFAVSCTSCAAKYGSTVLGIKGFVSVTKKRENTSAFWNSNYQSRPQSPLSFRSAPGTRTLATTDF